MSYTILQNWADTTNTYIYLRTELPHLTYFGVLVDTITQTTQLAFNSNHGPSSKWKLYWTYIYEEMKTFLAFYLCKY